MPSSPATGTAATASPKLHDLTTNLSPNAGSAVDLIAQASRLDGEQAIEALRKAAWHAQREAVLRTLIIANGPRNRTPAPLLPPAAIVALDEAVKSLPPRCVDAVRVIAAWGQSVEPETPKSVLAMEMAAEYIAAEITELERGA